MSDFQEIVKALSECHNKEISNYTDQLVVLQIKDQQYETEFQKLKEEHVQLQKAIAKAKKKILLKSQETHQLRQILIKNGIDAPLRSQMFGFNSESVNSTQDAHSSSSSDCKLSQSRKGLQLRKHKKKIHYREVKRYQSSHSINDNPIDCVITCVETYKPERNDRDYHEINNDVSDHRTKDEYLMSREEFEYPVNEDEINEIGHDIHNENITLPLFNELNSTHQYVTDEESHTSDETQCSPDATRGYDGQFIMDYPHKETDVTINQTTESVSDSSNGSPSLLRDNTSSTCTSSCVSTTQSPPICLLPAAHEHIINDSVLFVQKSKSEDVLTDSSHDSTIQKQKKGGALEKTIVMPSTVDLARSRKRKKKDQKQTTLTQQFQTGGNISIDSNTQDHLEITTIGATQSPVIGRVLDQQSRSCHIIPPTPWVRPQSTLISNWKELVGVVDSKVQEHKQYYNDGGDELDAKKYPGSDYDMEDPVDVSDLQIKPDASFNGQDLNASEHHEREQITTCTSTTKNNNTVSSSKTFTHAQKLARRAGLPNYKCSVVMRKKEDRAKLDGKACPQCLNWFREGDGIYRDKREHLKKTCRHKHLYHPPDSDPTLWNISFPHEDK